MQDKFSILNACSLFIRLLNLLLAIAIIGTLTLFTLSFLNHSVADKIVMENALKAGYGLNDLQFLQSSDNIDKIVLADLDLYTRIWLLMRISVYFILVLIILNIFQKVLHNIRNLYTFYSNNIQHFRALGYLTFIIAFFNSFNLNFLGEEIHLYFAIPLKTVGLAFGFLALSEIFKHGKDLQDDKNTIV